MGITRRTFVSATASAGLLSGLIGRAARGDAPATATRVATRTAPIKPALLGGTPARSEPFPAWPIYDQTEADALVKTLQSGKWFRGSGSNITAFEPAFAELMGAKYCIGTSSGTTALIASMIALGVGAGDEVILPPYTFIACLNAILMLGALPVFVDVDPETFQLDVSKVEAAITDRTRAIMPVHLGGSAVDLDALLPIARAHEIAVVEDTCQAHLAEWRGRKLGTFGETGCFSFQASKNLTAGEGGAIITNDERLAETCFTIQNHGRGRRMPDGKAIAIRGANFRMSEFHAALLRAQMARLPDQTRRREENSAYLTKLLGEIPGIEPARVLDGCTRHGNHLYLFRYGKEHFKGLPRAVFLKALAAEGIPVSSGYRPLNQEPVIEQTLQSRGYRRSFPKSVLAEWVERNACPANDQLCEEACWFTQNTLLADRAAIDQIAEAMGKIADSAAEITSASAG